jgi:GrpB-like predicted nucleotidyltransferase (UPF0157 family)
MPTLANAWLAANHLEPKPMAHPLRLMTHNPNWRQEFEQSRSLILWATEGWVKEVQHIGSTALQDGIAQPVIDLLAGLPDLQGLNQAAELIEGLNYTRVAAPEWCGEELTAELCKPRVGAATHRVLLVRLGGAAWRRALAVRDWLSGHPHDWQQFQALKRAHFTAGCDAWERYTTAKDQYFHSLEQQLK